MREEACLTVIQFAIQTDCLDQTIFQSLHIADTYLRRNPNVQPAFLKIIYAISLEISIKLNEQMILSLEDLVTLFENRYTLGMLQQLERHIFQICKFRINPCTPMDFLLHFVFAER